MEHKAVPKYHRMVGGIPVPEIFPVEAIESALSYQPKKGEIFIVTYPKSGTTWMHNILLLILRHGKVSDNVLDFFLGCIFLEMTGAEAVDYMIRPGAIKTHFPYHKVPKCEDGKYIYVCRNPKDCLVSFYYHMKAMPAPGTEEITFDDFFELFISGDLPYGDYFDHIMAWYEHRNDPNVYIVTYERLKKDIKGEILKLAKFVGEEYEKVLLDDPKVLDNVIHYSSLEYMKKNTNETMQKFMKGEFQFSHDGKELPTSLVKFMEGVGKMEQADKAAFQFVRKGVVGDWKNHLSADQSRRLDERIAQKTANSDVMSLWD